MFAPVALVIELHRFYYCISEPHTQAGKPLRGGDFVKYDLSFLLFIIIDCILFIFSKWWKKTRGYIETLTIFW